MGSFWEITSPEHRCACGRPIFSTSLFTDSGDYNTGGVESGSTGYKVGVGYLLNKCMSLSLEYLDSKISRSSVSYQGINYTYGSEDIRKVTVSLGFNLGSLF